MPPVTIYTTSWCPYCRSAKALLSKKGVAFTEIDVEAKPGARQEMTAGPADAPRCRRSSSARSMSGGSDDIHALDARGELDASWPERPASPSPRSMPQPCRNAASTYLRHDDAHALCR